jgi:hypothetical protein
MMTTMTSSRKHITRPFSGPQLATMVMLLGVVGMMMYSVGNPQNWKWVEQPPPAEPAAITSPTTPEKENKPNQDRIRYDATSQGYNENKVEADNPTDPNYHWDQDPEELADIKREFSVITDGTLSLNPADMHAYGRFLRWIKTRAYQDLFKSARKDWTYHDFKQNTNKVRGNLYRIRLNVKRILEHEFSDPTTQEKRKIYEVLGYSEEDSGDRLYFVITPELPEGMPTGKKIEEQATVVGYFLKMQGYEDGLAKPGAAPEKAPFLIGRLAWEPQIRRTNNPQRIDWSGDWKWWVLGGVFVGYLGLRWWLKRGSPKRESVTEILANKDRAIGTDNDKIASWLDNADANSIPDDADDDEVEIPNANFETPASNSKKNRRRKS